MQPLLRRRAGMPVLPPSPPERARAPLRGTGARGCALALLLLLAPGCGSGAAVDRIVLVTIDTLRADHVGAYGGPAGATPALDALAAEGVRFETAISPTPLTLPSHTSLLTGLDPPRHGVRNNSTFRLSESIPTLAERLGAAGFATAAFVGAAVLDRQYGLARGFDHYDDHMSPRRASGRDGFAERTADEVVDAALSWLDAAPERFFLWVHVYDPHADYAPPERFRRRFPDVPYQGEIAFADHEIGRLLRSLDLRGPRERTLVVVTSDHGESLGEHGELTHAYTIYDATQRVPLLLRGAGLGRGVVARAPARLIDVAPTLLALAHAEPFSTSDGADLRPLLGAPPEAGRTAYLETLATQIDLGWSPLLGLRTPSAKYIRAPLRELYDLAADPGETRNLAPAKPGRVRELDARLEAELARGAVAPARLEPDPEQRARLEALGYVAEARDRGDRPLGAVGGIDPKDGIPLLRHFAEAMGLVRAGRAKEGLARLAHLEGGGFVLDLLRAEAARAAGDSAAAQRYAHAAVAARPDFPGAWIALGEALEAGGRPGEAERAYRRALALDEASAGALVGLGRIAEARGARERAEARYREALERRGASAEALWRLAALALEAGREDEARSLLGRVPDAELDWPTAAARLAEAEARAGHGDAARARLARAREHWPESPELDAAEQAISKLGSAPPRGGRSR